MTFVRQQLPLIPAIFPKKDVAEFGVDTPSDVRTAGGSCDLLRLSRVTQFVLHGRSDSPSGIDAVVANG
jgi:hypothetical protein